MSVVFADHINRIADQGVGDQFQNRPMVIESKPATFMVSKGLGISWQVLAR
jgi:hypothetical protein